MARLSDLVRQQPPPFPGSSSAGGTGAAPPDRPNDPARSAATGRANVQDWYGLAMAELTSLIPVIQQGTLGNLGELPRIATGIAEALQESDALVAKALAGDTGNYLVANSVRVSILATRMGIGLGYAADELARLALAGLVHDVGMFLIPDSTLSQPGPLSESDREIVEQHPDVSAEVLATLGPSYEWLREVVVQEHERWNGQGYPQGLKQEEIQPQAQLIGIADVFEALISTRPYHGKRAPHEAIREILVQEKTSFSRMAMKGLVEQMCMYPLGTTVRLNNGEIGVVTGSKANYPLRPIIRLSTEGGDAAGETRRIDLSTTSLLHIVEVVTPHEGG